MVSTSNSTMDRKVLTAIFSFVFGVFVSSSIFIQPLISLLILIVGIAVLIPDRNKEVILLSLILISFGLGALRYSVKDFHEVGIPLETGIVVSEPENRE